MAFGYRVAQVLPKLPLGITGLRNEGQDRTMILSTGWDIYVCCSPTHQKHPGAC